MAAPQRLQLRQTLLRVSQSKRGESLSQSKSNSPAGQPGGILGLSLEVLGVCAARYGTLAAGGC